VITQIFQLRWLSRSRPTPFWSPQESTTTVRGSPSHKPWLTEIIELADPPVVITLGGQALKALNRIERRGLTLDDVGQGHSSLEPVVVDQTSPRLYTIVMMNGVGMAKVSGFRNETSKLCGVSVGARQEPAPVAG
jgi:hypothetical protein